MPTDPLAVPAHEPALVDPRLRMAQEALRSNIRACVARGVDPDPSTLHACVCLEAVLSEDRSVEARAAVPLPEGRPSVGRTLERYMPVTSGAGASTTVAMILNPIAGQWVRWSDVQHLYTAASVGREPLDAHPLFTAVGALIAAWDVSQSVLDSDDATEWGRRMSVAHGACQDAEDKLRAVYGALAPPRADQESGS